MKTVCDTIGGCQNCPVCPQTEDRLVVWGKGVALGLLLCVGFWASVWFISQSR
jgi:hypothetical protein